MKPINYNAMLRFELNGGSIDFDVSEEYVMFRTTCESKERERVITSCISHDEARELIDFLQKKLKDKTTDNEQRIEW